MFILKYIIVVVGGVGADLPPELLNLGMPPDSCTEPVDNKLMYDTKAI
jgi:hypothetical protein